MGSDETSMGPGRRDWGLEVMIRRWSGDNRVVWV